MALQFTKKKPAAVNTLPYQTVLKWFCNCIWYQLTRVVPDKIQKSRKMIVCVCVEIFQVLHYAKDVIGNYTFKME